MNRTYIALFLATVLLSACTHSGDNIIENIIIKGDTVVIKDTSPILAKLRIDTVAVKPFCSEFRTVGTVQAPTGRFAEVAVPFDGRIMSSRVMLGAKVRKGDTLFEMSSPDFLETCKQYFQNVRNYDKARLDYERKKMLHEDGIVSTRELEESYTESENARQEVESAEATLRVYGMDPGNLDLGQAMRIVAPINGEVVYNGVTVGSYIKADSEPLVTIADLRTVWVTALVKERFIGAVTEGAKAEIFTEYQDGIVVWGEIVHVGNLVDEQTRSIQVVISCANEGLQLKHGMYVSVHFLSEPFDSIVIPSTALFEGDNGSYVYVRSEGGPDTFVKRKVVAGPASDDKSELCIRSGLYPGECIVVDGGLYLNN